MFTEILQSFSTSYPVGISLFAELFSHLIKFFDVFFT